MIKIKRIYEPAGDDGFRILVDRLWPRGISRDEIKLNLWLKDVAPSTELRKWFSHDAKKWAEFRKRYKKELMQEKEPIERLKAEEKIHKKITLLYSAKDEKHNNAIVLKEILSK